VGITDRELLNIAIPSRVHSGADILVANCLEWAKDRAFLIRGKKYEGDPQLAFEAGRRIGKTLSTQLAYQAATTEVEEVKREDLAPTLLAWVTSQKGV
jgi:hypothetical protein